MVSKSVTRSPRTAFLIMLGIAACAPHNDGPLLVLDGDEEKSCSELHAEYESAEQLSEQNIDARRRWLRQLLRQGDCRLPWRRDAEFKFHLTIPG